MSEMVEWVARALWADRAARIKSGGPARYGFPSRADSSFDDLEAPMQDALRSEARAAIAALRESTVAMRQAAFHDGWTAMGTDYEDFGRWWSTMVDAALHFPPGADLHATDPYADTPNPGRAASGQ